MKLLQVEKPDILFHIILVLLLIFPVTINGQDSIPPVTPVFTGVTVNTSNGNIDMIWQASISPDVAGYVIYEYDTIKKEAFYIDTIFNPAAISYSAYRPKTAYESESYVVAAFDNSGNISPLSNTLNTIYNKATLDSCNNKITLRWNRYPSFPYKVTGYDILISENGGAYQAAGHVGPGTMGFVIESFNNGSDYCYLIRAVLENSQASSSSKACLSPRIQTVPQWINADFATVSAEGVIMLSFTIDPTAETDLFVLERKTGRAGTFGQIAIIRSGVGTITYTDSEANQEVENFYRLTALNACETAVAASNISSNMILTNKVVNNNIELTWNGYHGWLGEVSAYRISLDTGNGFSEYAEVQASDTTYSVPVPDIIYSASSGNICFLVTAYEVSNPHGINGISSSNRSCYAISEMITVPNLFTPDGDLKNDLFRPVFTFTPVDYHLVISDRLGRVVFETRNYSESWDGTDNGDQLPQGVYIWSLRVKTLSGKHLSRTGTVTIYRNR